MAKTTGKSAQGNEAAQTYNFYAKYEKAIQDGTKTQTLRAKDDKAPPAPGERVELTVAKGSGNARKALDPDPVVTRVAEVTLSESERGHLRARVAGQDLRGRSLARFAWADGFDSLAEMRDHWRHHYGLPWTGWLIQWEPPQ